ncbi:hypothetical protein Hanom_Chr15g01372831 [Helianthus anomalus]
MGVGEKDEIALVLACMLLSFWGPNTPFVEDCLGCFGDFGCKRVAPKSSHCFGFKFQEQRCVNFGYVLSL